MMPIRHFVFNDFQENTYLIYDEASREAFIIDPGMSTPQEEEILHNAVERLGLKVKAIINTHGHVDHIWGNPYAVSTFQAPLLIHQDDLPFLKQAPQIGMLWNINVPPQPEPDSFLKEGDILTIGKQQWHVLEVPGHSPGHIALYNPDEQVLISGDVLFAGSIGRTDLPGGDYATLMNSIMRLLSLGDAVKVLPGHGPDTSLGAERRTNPFIQEWLQRTSR